MKFINTTEHFESNERADCVVRALAVCLNCTYGEAYDYASIYLNRIDNKGVSTYILTRHLKQNAKELISFNYGERIKNPTFNNAVKTGIIKNDKTYFVLVRQHALAVKNGTIFGNESDAKISRKRIWALYEI